ncbi:MAG TPA: SpoIIE family protein phosphatase [Spirochaetales bacterium]|nr:SpoIIE family protein phosphatase [Spirochaetales bacterium]HRY55744.1 SpoIIE family protein phosphatase [Spirochaetia bacterium]HRZ65148.1 SpoIIE family protein phosphatase [Spirochaetia bacterium]
MTYTKERSLLEAGCTAAAAAAFLAVPSLVDAGIAFALAVGLAALAFLALFVVRVELGKALVRAAYRARLARPETRLVTAFAERVGASFSIPDLVEAIRELLEKPADMGAILVRSNTWEVLYQSPGAASSDPELLGALERNFREWSEGFSFFNDELSLASSNADARGFFVNAKGFHLFVLTRLCPFIELEAFRSLYGELRIYFDRVITISDLFEVASLAREWELIAQTQRSFLPRALPEVDKLDLAVAYRPLVNVSGDYYDVIPVDEARTLLLAGDVSGKGLAAALIMGIIVNTVRVAKDKADLAAIVRSVDQAVRDMGFDDKYTVLFLGLVDTRERKVSYVNAAMADPIVVSQTALGPRVRRLEPTMGLVGLVPLESVEVEEMPLRTDEILLLASDGVTEVDDAEGRRLGETELFEKALARASSLGAEDFVSSVTGLLYSFVGDRPLKDDVTILAAKAGRLWD